MASNDRTPSTEEVEKLVRDKLNKDKVKLWLPPYTTEDNQRGPEPQDLIASYSSQLNLPTDVITATIEKLRQHAVEKLAAKRKFQQTGVATLKVKLAGNVPVNAQQFTTSPGMSIEIGLHMHGSRLKEAITKQVDLDHLRLKVICSGHVVEDDLPLSSQHVTHGAQLMALYLSETEAQARRAEEQRLKVNKAREAAELLSSKVDGGEDDNQNYYLQIADQSGKPLDLPTEEKKALVLAMTLHEKGRAALKRKEYGEALLLLLEADAEFKKCRSDILDAVDNYAIICLDIVWCYLCLKNVNDLPDAEVRLQACDQCFRKSYGPNLERLAIVKGETVSQRALFMRLHLLQGILAFHQGLRPQASELLARAESELLSLKVDDDKMMELMSMGFNQQAARLALRACQGNVQLAVAHIMKKNEEREERRKKEKEERQKKKIAKSLGKTANGQDVNVDGYESLLSMGFSKGASAEALRQSNNDIPMALQVLQDHPEFLSLPDPDAGAGSSVTITDEMLAQVTAMGFDPEVARAALEHFKSRKDVIERAINELIQRGGSVPPDWLQGLASSSSSDSSGSSSSSSETSSPSKSQEERDRENALIETIIPDIPEEEEDYLDLTLEEEEQFLQQYQSLLIQ